MITIGQAAVNVLGNATSAFVLAETMRMQKDPWRIAQAVYGKAPTVQWPPLSGETPVQVLHDCACRLSIFDDLLARGSRDWNLHQHACLIAAENALLEIVEG